jgi:chromosome segregation ATPase
VKIVPGDKDLEKLIAGIGQEEQATAQKQVQIDRLKQLVEKQKKELVDQQKMIQELQSKVTNMYDLPADVEELKRLIGEQRGELNEKDHALEMANAQLAQLEAETKGYSSQSDSFSKNLDNYITQVGELKASLFEKDGLLKAKDRDLEELRIRCDTLSDQLSQMDGEVKERFGSVADATTRITILEKQVEDANRRADEAEQLRAQIEAELSEKMTASQGELSKKVGSLEKDRFTKEMAVKEAEQRLEAAESSVNDLKAQLEDIMAKYDNLIVDNKQVNETMKQLQAERDELAQFKEVNANVVNNLQGLVNLFEQEPLFKAFNIVGQVGEVNIDDLKNALGVPSVTTNKYIKQFIDADLMEMGESGKVRLKNPMPDFAFPK